MDEGSENSWDEKIMEQFKYELQEMNARELLKVIEILKSLKINRIKGKFLFGSESQQQTFTKYYKNQESHEEELWKQTSRSFNQDKIMEFGGGSENKKNTYFIMQNSNEAKIFFKHYSEKLEQISNEHHIQFKQINKIINISTERKMSSNVKSQLTSMRARLKFYTFYKNPKMYKIAKSSQLIRERLAKNGIHTFYVDKHKYAIFYSTEFKQRNDEIKRQVLKMVSKDPKILDLYDYNLKFVQNKIIFGLLTKNIKESIEKITNIYEAEFEVNANQSCFVLHTENEIFETEPVSFLSNKISNLFFFSFPIENSRSYANQFKKIGKKNNYLEVNYYKKRFYCSVDRRKIKDREIILKIFKGFLEELSERSELIIYLYSYFVLSKNSSLREQIIDLTQKHRLEISNFAEVSEREIHNAVIKPKNVVNLKKDENKKKKAQLNFINFLVELLMLQQKNKFTEEQISESLKEKKVVEEQEKNPKYKEKEPMSKREQEKQTNSQLNSIYIKEQKSESVINLNNESKENNESNFYHIGAKINFTMKEPQKSSIDPFEKGKVDKQLGQFIEEEQSIRCKCFKLAIDYTIFPLDHEIDRTSGFLVTEIIEQGNRIPELKMISFTSLKANETGYLVYLSNNEKNKYIPTHVIKRL